MAFLTFSSEAAIQTMPLFWIRAIQKCEVGISERQASLAVSKTPHALRVQRFLLYPHSFAL